jgi:hypothetical protein
VNAPFLPLHAKAESAAHARAVAAWIRSQEHATDCLCISCAPVSTPMRSPSVNDTKPIGDDLEVAQASALFQSLGQYERRVARAMLQALVKVQGMRG